jgi:methionyl-tRNA formyltransferase
MRIVFMGTPRVAALSLERLLNSPHTVAGVVTQPDRPAGRGQKSAPSPVRSIAEKHGVAVLAPEKVRDPAFFATLAGWSPEIIVVVAYGRILPRQILELAPHGCLNVHYSLLPKYRGAAPVAWAVINGEAASGVTTMHLVEKMDAGPILLQREIALTAGETTATLQEKLAPLGADLLIETLAGIAAGTVTPKTQDEAAATYAPIIKKEDGLIDWKLPAPAIERRVRGFTPWPTAYTQFDGTLLKIHRARVVLGESGAPGEVVRADRGGLWVAAGAGTLALEEVQLENRRRVSAAEFFNGSRIEKGARLGAG